MAQEILNPDQMALFRRMQASEQAHSLAVMKRLRIQAIQEDQSVAIHRQDLLAAALLHDAGKCLYPLHIWDRVLVVLGEWFFPDRVDHWGSGSPDGWKRAFVVAKMHPNWGSELAAQAGSSATTVELIRRHQLRGEQPSATIVDHLLHELQAADRDV